MIRPQRWGRRTPERPGEDSLQLPRIHLGHGALGFLQDLRGGRSLQAFRRPEGLPFDLVLPDELLRSSVGRPATWLMPDPPPQPGAEGRASPRHHPNRGVAPPPSWKEPPRV